MLSAYRSLVLWVVLLAHLALVEGCGACGGGCGACGASCGTAFSSDACVQEAIAIAAAGGEKMQSVRLPSDAMASTTNNFGMTSNIKVLVKIL